jgi:hypothetical protein
MRDLRPGLLDDAGRHFASISGRQDPHR